jgi:ABC-type uncharacterized transport system permease subunit
MTPVLNLNFFTSFLTSAVRMGIPFAYASLGEAISQKSGVINIGLEANMLCGAFFGFTAAYFSGSLLIGFLTAALAGMLISLGQAFFAIYLRRNQNVIGTAFNMFALGLTSFFYQLLVNHYASSYPQIDTLKQVTIPGLSSIPLIGRSFFSNDIVVYLLYIIIIAMMFFLKKTAWGSSLVAVGENPQAADTAGISVYKTRYLAAAFNGIMSGIGGAYLTLGQLGVFSENITSGRGYISLSLVVFGRRNPIGVFLSSVFIGAANALQFKMQAFGVKMPTQFFSGLPYILTVIVLIISAVKKNDSDPASLGKPYVRTMR